MTEYAYVLGETYPSARATPELVGRENELEQIYAAIRDTSQSYVIYITGEGGIGKTRLAKHILENIPQDIEAVAASKLIDLYHTPSRTIDGLIERIQETLYVEFVQYQTKQDQLNKYRASGGTITPSQITDLREAFLADWATLSQQHRIVLALDTIETLYQQEDPAAQALHLSEERPAVLEWLNSKFLKQAKNFVLLLSGRPLLGNLEEVLGPCLSNEVQCLTIDLKGLTADEANAYFEAVIQAIEKSERISEQNVATNIRSWSRQDRLAMFYCLRSDESVVAPIWLALTIDYLAIEGQPLAALTQPLEIAQRLSAEERQMIRNKLGGALITAIQDDRRPADVIITALGWLWKGGNVRLLASVTELNEEEVNNALEKIRDLSFVKIRPADNRIFLHDVMYSLLHRYALDRLSDPMRKRIFDSILGYYEEDIKKARSAIATLNQSESTLPDPDQVIMPHAHLEDTLVEDLHYQLRRDLIEGFQVYFRYAEEAIATHNESLDVQLRAELLSFLAAQEPLTTVDTTYDLFRTQVVTDAAVRWVKRLVETQQYEKALHVAEQLRNPNCNLLANADRLVWINLDTWEGLAHIYTGNYEAAQRMLTRAENELNTLQIPSTQLTLWSAALARNHNNLGYLRRVQGQFIAAAKAYRQALPHWRYIKIEAEQANTLTNLAYALALIGDFDNARTQANDALGLRKKLDARIPLALTYNTLARIEVLAGNYDKAERHAQRSLELSQTLGFQRGEGLAELVLSDVYRFRSEEVELSIREKAALLENALEYAQRAHTIFFKSDDEPERKIEALYKYGVAARQQCLVTNTVAEREQCVLSVFEYLNDARNLAEKEGLWPLYFDASFGLAWTYYYAHSHDDLKSLLIALDNKLHTEFNHYLITNDYFPKITNDTQVGIFNQLARFQVLYGVLALDEYDDFHRKPPYDDVRLIKRAVRHFTLALEYDEIVSKNGQGIRRALDTIHRRLKNRNNYEMVAVYQAIEETAHEFRSIKKEVRLWHEIESTYGPYKIFKLLTKQPKYVGGI